MHGFAAERAADRTMSDPLLVVVTGPPASGKSSIARELAAKLSIPFLSKDDLKERLYEELGSEQRLERAIERSALAILYSVAGGNLQAGVPVLVESNFERETATERLSSLRGRIVQVHCGGSPEALVQRFRERAADGERHSGHGDRPTDAEELRRKLEDGFWDPLDLPGETIRVDTTRGDVDIDAIASHELLAHRAT